MAVQTSLSKSKAPPSSLKGLKIDLNEVSCELARRHHEDFMRYTWMRPDPFKSGLHIKKICKRLDKAIEDYKKGISTYLAIKVPFRHSKSEILSRYLPPHFLGEFPDSEIIVTAYNAQLAQGFSRNARSILKSDKYRKLYKDIEISDESSSVGTWAIRNHMGLTNWCGILSGATGKGAGLLLIDDFFSGREQAESIQIREKVWETFSDDLMSRLAPVHIVVILATDWHVDSLFGRIDKQMEESPTFPKFEVIRFPAQDSSYPGGWLWLERYPESWYVAQKGSRSLYSFNSIMQNNPTVRGTTMLRTDKIQFITSLPQNLRQCRGWDLASSTKELNKSDPDYTVGVKVCVDWINSNIPGVRTPRIYIIDVIRGQWEATLRQNICRDAAIAEANVRVGVEDFGSYKDAYVILRDSLMGIRHVEPSTLPGSKTAKYETLVPIFESGNVFVVCPPDTKNDNGNVIHHTPTWYDDFVDELDVVPNGAHDDQADALCVAFDIAKKLSSELVHTNTRMISDLPLVGEKETLNGLYIDEKYGYIVTADWDPKYRKLHIKQEIALDTLEAIAAYVKVSKANRTLALKEADSNSTKSVQNNLTAKGAWINTDESFDPLGSLFFLNSLIDTGRFTISSKCRNLLLNLQNNTEIKNIGSYLNALLYIINNLTVMSKDPKADEPLKPFSKEKVAAQKQFEEEWKGTAPKHKNKLGWY